MDPGQNALGMGMICEILISKILIVPEEPLKFRGGGAIEKFLDLFTILYKYPKKKKNMYENSYSSVTLDGLDTLSNKPNPDQPE